MSNEPHAPDYRNHKPQSLSPVESPPYREKGSLPAADETIDVILAERRRSRT